jgi:ATP-dependent Clp protease ATP-binding subunit ClpA
MVMFERFTNQSRRVVVLAQQEARVLNHNYIGTEHLLLGLLHEGKGTAAAVLGSAGVTLDAARDQVVSIVGRGEQKPSGHIPFTSRAKKSLELSLREALQLGDGYIGTGHLLLGVFRQGDNVAIKVLGALDADLKDLRARVVQELHDHPEEGRDAASASTSASASAERERQNLRVFLRDQAQGLLDTIEDRLGAIERHLGITQPGADELRSLDERLAQVRRDKQVAIDVQDFAEAAALRETEKQLIRDRERVEGELAAAAVADAAESAADVADAGDADVADAGVAGPGVAEGEELTRLRARVAGLEARLREHGLDPDELQDPPAAAG